jgi:hypothetical protein
MIESRSPVELVLSTGGAFAPETGLVEAATKLGVADPEKLGDWLRLVSTAVEVETYNRVAQLVAEQQRDGVLPARDFLVVILNWLTVAQERATAGAFTIGLGELADAFKDGRTKP